MPVFQLDERLVFPPPQLADPDGLLAVGGDLRPERLVLAYSSGIFPWPTEGYPLLWHSPDPRFVLRASELHIPRSLKKQIRRGIYRVTLDSAFRQVIEACARKTRPSQEGTWITVEMVEAYVRLFGIGLAHSAEAWAGDELVGGLYGVSLGGAFFGESMFAYRADASKIAFVLLVQQLQSWGIDIIDAQVHTSHLQRFGARHWPRERYLAALAEALRKPTLRGPWQLDAAPPCSVPGRNHEPAQTAAAPERGAASGRGAVSERGAASERVAASGRDGAASERVAASGRDGAASGRDGAASGRDGAASERGSASGRDGSGEHDEPREQP